MSMNRIIRNGLVCCVFLLACVGANSVRAQILRIRDICRVKGQEENTLLGRGLVVGLNGTGDSDPSTLRSLARMMQLMGGQVSLDAQRQPDISELKNVKNVATVFVTATVPAEGARQGEKLDCTVHAINAKSLVGGKLMLTTLTGPNPNDQTVYALAGGMIDLDTNGSPTSGRVNQGCRLEANFMNPFLQDGKITLVLDQRHASFQTANDIEELLNSPNAGGPESRGSRRAIGSGSEARAKAIDQVNIEVTIPNVYQDAPLQFISQVMETRIVTPTHDASVVIDRRNGVIVIGDNVLVGRVAVSINAVRVQTGTAPPPETVFVLDQSKDTNVTKLNALVDALNSLQVETDDIIAIIDRIHTNRQLYEKLIVK
ncbi:MAG: flagellar basal body P-ring protein FlgI [Pirellulaceae bacterium]|nr:flagellar basal body P-ring protein FlgI [Pirellulaceae bacterium]HJN09060.1 flagellar basal body P-ring protein FlgI [Pirellulaceae bacterium]